jgi:hypothetical protein
VVRRQNTPVNDQVLVGAGYESRNASEELVRGQQQGPGSVRPRPSSFQTPTTPLNGYVSACRSNRQGLQAVRFRKEGGVASDTKVTRLKRKRRNSRQAKKNKKERQTTRSPRFPIQPE